jgi:hypothetical protein
MSIADEIQNANSFGNQIQNLIVAKGQCPADDRNVLLLGYWSLVFDFHRGVLCLLSNKFYGSAFALVRSIVETTVRAHVAIMGSNEDVERLKADDYRTNLATIGKEIDTFFRTETLFETFLARARVALHSYTHAGTMQLSRRFSGHDLEANYKEGEITEVIRAATSAVFIVNNLVTKHFGFEEEWMGNNRLFLEWGKHS